jgi:soluble lytic murein transglycosylase-like protein
LLAALVEQESSWNPWAYRYEPAFYNHYILPLNLSEQTGRFRATSWGLGQIMGQTARELGFVGEFFSELCDPDTGLDFAAKKLKACLIKHDGERSALEAYNGGSNPTYADQVLSRKEKYQ